MMRRLKPCWNVAVLACSGIIGALALGGCAGPPVLGEQVIGYDEVAKSLDEKLLLLNIARVAHNESVHFTSTSSIAATFDWTTTIGAGGRINSGSAANFLDLNVGASASENPTFSIIPVSGQDFTRRVVTPFHEEAFEFLVYQGGRINQVMRLLAGGIEVQKHDGSYVRFIENDPRRREEYEEFRRIAMHLQWLNDHRKLFVRTLVFEETLVADFQGMPSAEDINNGFDKGLRWRQKPNGHYALTRLRAGRVVVSNFDPMALTDQARFELNERIRRNPEGFVHLEIRPDGPGGAMPLEGAIKLRSMFQILSFLARGMRNVPEFAVSPAPATGAVVVSPAATLKINVTDSPPRDGVPSIRYRDAIYAVNDSDWDLHSFLMLSVLFQTTVGKLENVGIPITISK